jgi:hypothetical protein
VSDFNDAFVEIKNRDVREFGGYQFRHDGGFDWKVYRIHIYPAYNHIHTVDYLMPVAVIQARNNPTNQELMDAFKKINEAKESE